MEFLYGYSVDRRPAPGTRYDQIVEALGCHGELVERPDELRPALERALCAPAGRRSSTCCQDPDVVYPRSRTSRETVVRVAVVDIGTNSTRLLIADADPASGEVVELERRSTSRGWAPASTAAAGCPTRRWRACSRRSTHTAKRSTRWATSRRGLPCSRARCATPPTAPSSRSRVREDYGLDARTIPGEEEARLSLPRRGGARAGDAAARRRRHRRRIDRADRRRGRERALPRLDAGRRRAPERAPRPHDPPLAQELEELAADAGEIFAAAVPERCRDGAAR